MSARCHFFESWTDSSPRLRAAWGEWLARHGIDPAVAPDIYLVWCDDEARRVYVDRALSEGTELIAAVQLEAPALPFPSAHEVVSNTQLASPLTDDNPDW